MSEEKNATTASLKVIKTPKKDRRNLINIIVILTITFGYTIFSLWGDLPDVISVFKSQDADYRMILVILALIALKFMIEGLILFFFARLYTTTYKYHRGVANAFIGQFFSDITPSSTGGQFIQVKTFAKQGVPVAVSASILVMHFILFQIVLVAFGALSILLNIPMFSSLAPITILGFSLPVWLLSLFGFLINLLVIVGLFLLSYSKAAHSFFINWGVDFLAKLRIVKKPKERKEKLYVSTENFRVELRRLSANFPASIFIMILFALKMVVQYSFTYVVAIMLDPNLFGTLSYIDSVSKSSFLSMITGFIPIPGAAGFAEYFFEVIFASEFNGNVAFTKAVQIVWRFATFYITLVIGGLVTAFYRSSMEEFVDDEGHVKTFEEVKSATFLERQETSNTLYQTSQLSIKEIQRRLTPKKRRKKSDEPEDHE